MLEWDESKYGPKDEYRFLDRDSLGGVKVGDRVDIIKDDPDDDYFVGEDGVVIGLVHRTANIFGDEARDELLVWFDDRTDPVGVDPEHVDTW